jgi:hypothetical protein
MQQFLLNYFYFFDFFAQKVQNHKKIIIFLHKINKKHLVAKPFGVPKTFWIDISVGICYNIFKLN